MNGLRSLTDEGKTFLSGVQGEGGKALKKKEAKYFPQAGTL